MEGIAFDEDKADIHEIRRAIAALFDSMSVVELRILNAADGARKQGTVSGYFDGEHRNELAEVAAYWSGKAPAVYVMLNPVLPDILARSANRAQTWVKITTKDTEIVTRVWLLIDFDPKRPSGISATDAEHEAALDRARQCLEWLRGQGWPDPVFADSGNGAHLLYRIDLPNDSDAQRLVKGCLEAIAARLSDKVVEVDRSVHNAARICKLYGTLAAKGDETPDRPHRIARMLDVPESVQVVPRELLQALCGASARPDLPTSDLPAILTDRFDLQAWIVKHKVPVGNVKEWEGGILYELRRCPWRPDQTDGGAFVAQDANGRLSAGCHHNKCQGKGWHDLRDIFEPGWRDSTLSLTGQAKEGPDDPHRLARLYIVSKCTHSDGPTLYHWCGQWYSWTGTVWKTLADAELNAALTGIVKAEFDRLSIQAQASGQERTHARKVTASVVSNVFGALRSLLILPSDLQPPAWLRGTGHWPADEIIVARNGIVHLPSLATGQDCFRKHSPQFFSLHALNYDIMGDCGEPARWLEFLGQLWPKDAESVVTLQQWFGYCLTSDTRHQKILLIIGPKRSGKGTIARVLRALVGPENVAGPTLASLATTFGLQALLGKTVAIISDARLSNRPDISVIIERLLSISGEDNLTIDRKHRDFITAKLDTRLMILSNEVPRLVDASGALASRMIVLRLVHSFSDKEDIFLTDKLCAELPGILLWAAEGWRLLREQRSFMEPPSADDLRRELEELGSPVGAFIEECCLVGSEYAIVRADLFRAYRAWCHGKGRTHVEHETGFGRDLRAALPSLDNKQASIGGRRVREYVGITLRPGIVEALAKDELFH